MYGRVKPSKVQKHPLVAVRAHLNVVLQARRCGERTQEWS